MAFWGVVLKPGASKGVDQSQGDVMHLSQACLHDPKEGKNYLMAKVGKDSYSLACLQKGKKEHDTFDLFFSSDDCTFVNKGQSEIHLTGYFEPDGMGDDEDDESEDMQPTKSEAAAAARSPKATAAASPKQSPKVAAAKAAAAPASDSDDEDEEEEEASMDEDEESEEEAQPAAKGASPKVAAAAKAAAAADDDSDGSEDEESEEELDADGSEDEESEEESAPAPAKRGAPAAAASPAKKAKTDGGSKDKWVAAIHAYLKKSGKKTLGDIGSAVPRPADVPKMKLKQLFEEHMDKFSVTGDNVVAK